MTRTTYFFIFLSLLLPHIGNTSTTPIKSSIKIALEKIRKLETKYHSLKTDLDKREKDYKKKRLDNKNAYPTPDHRRLRKKVPNFDRDAKRKIKRIKKQLINKATKTHKNRLFYSSGGPRRYGWHKSNVTKALRELDEGIAEIRRAIFQSNKDKNQRYSKAVFNNILTELYKKRKEVVDTTVKKADHQTQCLVRANEIFMQYLGVGKNYTLCPSSPKAYIFNYSKTKGLKGKQDRILRKLVTRLCTKLYNNCHTYKEYGTNKYDRQKKCRKNFGGKNGIFAKYFKGLLNNKLKPKEIARISEISIRNYTEKIIPENIKKLAIDLGLDLAGKGHIGLKEGNNGCKEISDLGIISFSGKSKKKRKRRKSITPDTHEIEDHTLSRCLRIRSGFRAEPSDMHNKVKCKGTVICEKGDGGFVSLKYCCLTRPSTCTKKGIRNLDVKNNCTPCSRIDAAPADAGSGAGQR